MNSLEHGVPPQNPEMDFYRRRHEDSRFELSKYFVSKLIYDEAKYIIDQHKTIDERASTDGVKLQGFKGNYLHLTVDEGEEQVILQSFRRGLRFGLFDRIHFGIGHYEQTAIVAYDRRQPMVYTAHEHRDIRGKLHEKHNAQPMELKELQAAYDLMHLTAVQDRTARGLTQAPS